MVPPKQDGDNDQEYNSDPQYTRAKPGRTLPHPECNRTSCASGARGLAAYGSRPTDQIHSPTIARHPEEKALVVGVRERPLSAWLAGRGLLVTEPPVVLEDRHRDGVERSSRCCRAW